MAGAPQFRQNRDRSVFLLDLHFRQTTIAPTVPTVTGRPSESRCVLTIKLGAEAEEGAGVVGDGLRTGFGRGLTKPPVAADEAAVEPVFVPDVVTVGCAGGLEVGTGVELGDGACWVTGVGVGVGLGEGAGPVSAGMGTKWIFIAPHLGHVRVD